MGGDQRKRSGRFATLVVVVVLGACGGGNSVERNVPRGQAGTSVLFTAPPPTASPTTNPPGTRLAVEQFITLLRQGRIQTATVLRGGHRVAGTYDRGHYWVELSEPGEPIASRFTSALEDAGVALTVEPAATYQGPGVALRIDQFITLLRQGRIATATLVRAEERIVGSYDRGEYWVAYTGALLDRLTAGMRDAGLPVTER